MKYIFDKCLWLHRQSPAIHISEAQYICTVFLGFFVFVFLQHLSYCNITLFVIDKQEIIIQSPDRFKQWFKESVYIMFSVVLIELNCVFVAGLKKFS